MPRCSHSSANVKIDSLSSYGNGHGPIPSPPSFHEAGKFFIVYDLGDNGIGANSIRINNADYKFDYVIFFNSITM